MHRGKRIAAADYAAPGWYLITVVTADRRPLLGRLHAGGVSMSRIGHRVATAIENISHNRPWVSCIGSAIMPDHVHLIVGWQRVPDGRPGEVWHLVGGFKADVTRAARSANLIAANQILWQQSFDARFISDPIRLRTALNYIATNAERAWMKRTARLRGGPTASDHR